ncbi:MAG: hypothetical protein WCS96_13430, partial [Victivallales bacterium]
RIESANCRTNSKDQLELPPPMTAVFSSYALPLLINHIFDVDSRITNCGFITSLLYHLAGSRPPQPSVHH